MSLLRKFASVGSATMASRVLGFVREALIAYTLGAGPVSDAFYAAFRFPNLFRRLFAEGAFNSAFIPLFAKELEGGGATAAEIFARQVLSVLLFVLIALSAFAMIFMPVLVSTIIAPKFTEIPEKFELTVFLTRIMFPYLAAMSLVAMLSGVLNSYRHYFLAAISPVLLNIVLVGVLIAVVSQGVDERTVGVSMAVGVTVSGILQLALLVYGVRKIGFHIRIGMPRLTLPVRRLLWLALPAAITGGITQLNLLIGQIIISGDNGAIAIVNFADRILQLPLGVIGIAIGVVLLPELSRALKEGNTQSVQDLQNNSLEFGLGLTVPAAVAFAIIPAPIVALLFERGEFGRETTLITATVLAAFAGGLPAFVLNKIFTPSFYAREDMRSPMWFAGVNAAINVAGSLILFPIIGVMGIAIATSLAGWANALLLGGLLYRDNQFRPTTQTLKRVALIVAGSAWMGVCLYFVMVLMGPLLMDGSLLPRIALMIAVIAGGALVYFAFVLATGAMDRHQLMSLVRRRQE
ncbi:MAG: murein biosynthesis integral membrane protein MurJ [Hyphomicrobiales bacterium]|nr:murein biosynthesis integral membrane protein MurJ [Hyphomicrobiales bacterium]